MNRFNRIFVLYCTAVIGALLISQVFYALSWHGLGLTIMVGDLVLVLVPQPVTLVYGYWLDERESKEKELKEMSQPRQ